MTSVSGKPARAVPQAARSIAFFSPPARRAADPCRFFRRPGRRIAGERSIMLRLEGETLMPTGVVRSFNVKSGFGFIRPDDGSKDLFVHSGTVKRAGLKPLQEHQKISYDVRSELDGRRSAVDLKAV